VKKNKGKFKSIFDYFDVYLIIDKSVDFILIFVGLLAALGFENYIEKKNIEEKYTNSLTRLHTEITNNINFADGYFDTTQKYFSISEDLLKLVNKGAKKSYDGINKIIESETFSFDKKKFKSINQNEFPNNSLYSDILHLYDLYAKIETNTEIPKQALNDFYFSYYNIYSKQMWESNDVIQDYVDLNYKFNLARKTIPNLQSSITDAKSTSKRILKSIENELLKFDLDISSTRTYSDFYWLSYNSMLIEDYLKSNDYALMGIRKLNEIFNTKDEKSKLPDEISYYGRLNKNIVQNYYFIKNSNDSSDLSLDIIQNLISWEDTGVFKEGCYAYFCQYYYDKKNEEMFYKYLNKMVLESEDDFDILKVFLYKWSNFNKTKKAYEILSQAEIEGGWDSYINIRNEN